MSRYFRISEADPARSHLPEWANLCRSIADTPQNVTLANQIIDRVNYLLGISHKPADNFDPARFREHYETYDIDIEEIERRIRFRLIRDLRGDLLRYDRLMSASEKISPELSRQYVELSNHVRLFLDELYGDVESEEGTLRQIWEKLGIE